MMGDADLDLPTAEEADQVLSLDHHALRTLEPATRESSAVITRHVLMNSWPCC
jgi:hypothetical protein